MIKSTKITTRSRKQRSNEREITKQIVKQVLMEMEMEKTSHTQSPEHEERHTNSHRQKIVVSKERQPHDAKEKDKYKPHRKKAWRE